MAVGGEEVSGDTLVWGIDLLQNVLKPRRYFLFNGETTCRLTRCAPF
jgi:hypothetical protein